jgi:hypothetical protein
VFAISRQVNWLTSSLQLVENFNNRSDGTDSKNKAEEERYFDPEDPWLVKEAKRHIPDAVEFVYDERDVIVYNMGIGATEKELRWVYEGDENFSPIPTFGVCPQFALSMSLPFDWLPNFNPVSAPRFLKSEHVHLASPGGRRNFFMANTTYRSRPPFLQVVYS